MSFNPYDFIIHFPGAQRYVRIMFRHALFKASKGVLSTFQYLEMVDYSGTVNLTREIEVIGDLEYVDGCPYCNPQQFMPWFYLPPLTSFKYLATGYGRICG